MENFVDGNEATETADWEDVGEDKIPMVLAEMAKEGKDSIYILNSIRRIMKWSAKCPEVEMKMYRPKNIQWRSSVIVTAEGKLDVAFIFSPYKSCSFLLSAIRENGIIKMENQPMVYFGVPEEFFGHLEHEIISGEFTAAWSFVFNSYWLPPETAKKFKVDVPTGFTISRLDPSHASTVNSVWPYASASSLALVYDTILVNETAGLFEEKNSRLVSWILHVYYGLGMLYTEKEYRRRGYGTIMVKALSKRLAENGAEINLLAKEDNVEANSVFQKLGFQATGPVMVIQIQSRS
ncbi:uncharacterized protein [Hetaerina americana]|uniref:uncharacterized protein n=1 Tax=Hetaerina americana TaxID=62018 RepID=UPI003A7F53C3